MVAFGCGLCSGLAAFWFADRGARISADSKALLSHTPQLQSALVAGRAINWIGQVVRAACGQKNPMSYPADIGTRTLTAARLRSLMALFKLYDHSANALEGSDGPGKTFIKKHEVRALPCAMSLLNLQGCEVLEPANNW